MQYAVVEYKVGIVILVVYDDTFLASLSAEALAEFEKVKEFSLSQSNRYKYVHDWFVKRFPNYKELPTIINGKAYLNPPVEERRVA